MNQLIAVAFDHFDDARTAMASLRKLERAGQVRFEDTAVLQVDPTAPLTSRTRSAEPPKRLTVVGAVLGGDRHVRVPAAGRGLGAAAGALVGSLMDTGVESEVRRGCEGKLRPGRSALFLVTKEGPPRRCRAGRTARYHGDVIQTTLDERPRKGSATRSTRPTEGGRTIGGAHPERQLNRATLDRQPAPPSQRLGAVEAVHRVTALQAQEPASPYIALWNRVEALRAGSSSTSAFANHAGDQGHAHAGDHAAVDASDYPAFHEGMQTTLRAARLNDRRLRSTGLTAADADAVILDLVEVGGPGRGNGDFEAGWSSASVEPRNDCGGRCATTGRSSTHLPAARGHSGRGRPTAERRSRNGPANRWRPLGG